MSRSIVWHMYDVFVLYVSYVNPWPLGFVRYGRLVRGLARVLFAYLCRLFDNYFELSSVS